MSNAQIIYDNVQQIKENIAKAAISVGKKPEDITFVAATKMNDAENVKIAIKAGIDASGENRVQELLEKFEQDAYIGKPLHFIGTLQSNKVKYLVGKVDLIQSVSSLKLAEIISSRAEKINITQKILLEVNIGEESNKSGFIAEEIADMLEIIDKLPNIKVCGLMTIPPATDDYAKKIVFFDKMYKLFIDISTKKYDNVIMSVLSMGMSGDYYEAIAHGATMVRVGSAIFGARKYI